MLLKISNLKVGVNPSVNSGRGRKEILKGIDLEINAGEIHVLMGPNGSGKSTLAQVLMGSSQFTIDKGQLTFDQKDLRKLTPDKRAKLGIFLGFQHPVEVPGVSVFNVLRKAKKSRSMNNELRIKGETKHNSKFVIHNSKSIGEFRQQLLEHASSLKLDKSFLRRSMNEGFSGGEKKKNEVLQMLVLRPKLAILDEVDSGLDIDGLKNVASAIKKYSELNPQSSVLLITHYARILKYLKPDFVHVMVEGEIIRSGSAKLATQVEKSGYQELFGKYQR